MSKLHFLNVKNGDCTIIEHNTGHVSVIDVCNARLDKEKNRLGLFESIAFRADSEAMAEASGAKANYGQKLHPVNPIEYMQTHGIDNIFRLAITHPDMDHMDGINDLFEYSTPQNYYDTNNNKVMEQSWDGSPYREEDWKLYKSLRDGPKDTDPKCIRIYSGDNGIHRTLDWNGKSPGDSFHTLAPTRELVRQGNDSGDYNDAGYVFLWRSCAGKVLLAGDSHDKTWEHILANHAAAVSDVDLLLAPHHGRKSGRSFKFLDTVNPKMTFFGNAPSKDLSYDAWRTRGLPYITNNMAGSMIVKCANDDMDLYVTNEKYARDQNSYTFYSDDTKGWFIKTIS